MVVGAEMAFGNFYRRGVRNGDSVLDGTLYCRHLRQHPHRLGVADQPRELFANVACTFDAVLLGNQESAAGEEIEKRQLVGNCSEPVEFHKSLGQGSGKLPLTVQEDAFVWDEDVIKNRESLHHLVPRTDGMSDSVV